MSAIDDLMQLDPAARRHVLAALSQDERKLLMGQLDYRAANPWMKYQRNPVGFVEGGLGETLWSKQKEILNSIVENKRTAVPACHAPGKTHIAARAIAYWASVYPPGTSKIITTATNAKQVRNIMWPHVRRLHSTHQLPGYTNSLEWRMGDPPEPVAEGVKPPDNEEAAMQGYHAPNLLIVVDEAGGIPTTFGQSIEALMTGENTRLLVLGNPPTDQENTWFERICSSPMYNVIRIAAQDTPAFTGEYSGMCRSCPPESPPHEVVTHLVGPDWVEHDIRDQYGEESPMYIAKVLAQFPRDNTQKTLPISWLENVREANDSPDMNYDGGRVYLGVDIASDGGDEFVIAENDTWHVRIVHTSSGAVNADATEVAGKVLEHIRKAEAKHKARGIEEPVRVKLDALGVGWGVVSLLAKWGAEQKHGAQIVGVQVSERAQDHQKFLNKRAEMWWNTRTLIQPRPGEQEPELWLDMSHKELAQLNAPTYTTESGGRIQIEKKASMKKRGIGSPDRAEAVLLALYEPGKPRKDVAPVALEQVNSWAEGFTAWSN